VFSWKNKMFLMCQSYEKMWWKDISIIDYLWLKNLTLHQMRKTFLVFGLLLTLNHCSFAQTSGAKKTIFVCEPCGGSCDDLTFDKAGKCPHCSMALVDKLTLKQAKPADEKPLNICFYLQDRVEVLDFAGPLEVFRVAGFNVFTVSKTKDKISSLDALTIIPDYDITDAPAADVMVFFGGNHSAPTNDTAVIDWIKSRQKTTKYFMSVCTGAFIMGKAGILDNLIATTYHTQIERLRKELPKTKVLANVRFVDNGNVISTAGISAGIDGALHFVSKIQGKAAAQKVAKDMEYDQWIPEKGLIIKTKRAK
jgi:putative intracellular protease/amidase/DNA-directed RNA polymerase subunit RPC12/RpoP